jgi:hypothetical protein
MGLIRTAINKVPKLLLLPVLIYLLGFILLTYPLITYFSSSFMGDSQDVYQNVWSMWWFQQAVDSKELGLWFTNMLYAPQGETLYIHALSPLNGALAYPLQKLFPWHIVYNLLIVFNFVASGLAMFWLAFYYTKRYLPSLLSGFLFTFSAYHFLHSRGHIEMAAMQWLTFFLLSFVWLLDAPTVKKALLAALLLLLVLLNTPYHLLYAAMMGLVIAGANFIHLRKNQAQIKKRVKPLLLFCVIFFALASPLLIPFYQTTTQGNFEGTHNPLDFSAEISSYIARPAGYLGVITQGMWPAFLESPEDSQIVSSEASVRLTLVALLLSAWVLKKQWRSNHTVRLWGAVGLVFLVLSLGPILLVRGDPPIMGKKPLKISLPYNWLSQAFPPLKLSGVPARMGIIPLMATSLLAAVGFSQFRGKRGYVAISILFALLVLESLPKRFTPLEASMPDSVSLLAQQSPGIMLDRGHARSLAMYYQTTHEKPLVDGYLSRVSQKNYDYSRNLAVGQSGDNLAELCTKYQIKYLWTGFPVSNLTPIVVEQDTYLYDLKPQNICVN